MVRVLKSGVTALVFLVSQALLVGCGDGEVPEDRSLELMAPKGTDSELTAEQKRLRSLQMIKYEKIDSTGKVIGDPINATASELGQSIWYSCLYHVHDTLPFITTFDYWEKVNHSQVSFALGTEAIIGEIAASVCAGTKLREIADASAAPVVYVVKSKSVNSEEILAEYFRVPPQPDSVKVGLLKESRTRYLRAAARAIDLLEGGKITSYSIVTGCGQYGCGGFNYGVGLLDPSISADHRSKLAERLSQTLSMAINGYEAATNEAVEKTVAVADAQRGSTTSASLSAHRVWAGESLSRADAAHMLLGGASGLVVAGQPADGFCIHDVLSPGARRALSALRESGLPSSQIAAPGDITSLVEGRNCIGSVRERLAAKRRDDRLLGSLTVSDAVGASIEDFRLALDYLRQEQRAYGVTVSSAGVSTLALNCATSGAQPTVGYDFATAQPIERDSNWFAATARAGLKWTDPPVLENIVNDGELGLAQFYEVVGSRLAVLLSGSYAQLGTDSMQSLRLTINRLVDTEIGRVLVFGVGSPVNAVSFQVDLRVTAGTEPLLLVQGGETAECHSRGTVNGERRSSCAAAIATLTPYAPDDPRYPYSYYYYGSVPAGYNATSGEPLFVVGPAPSGSGKAILGTFPGGALTAGMKTVAIAPVLEQKAAEILKPGKNWCGRPAYECGGKDVFDGRMPLEMPLENELSTDNDGLESSWRYYLDRAATAAEEADALGEAYLTSAVEVEREKEADEAAAATRRAEAERELETVQEVCGTAVDSEQLFQFVAPQGGNTNSIIDVRQCTSATQCSNSQSCVAGRCTCSDDSQCPSDYPECVVGKCVRSRMAFVDGNAVNNQYQSRLKECLGEDTILSWVAAGNQPMCIWEYWNRQDPLKKRLACPGTNADAHCPMFVTPRQTTVPCQQGLAKATLTQEQRANMIVRYIPEKLGLFNSWDFIAEIRALELGVLDFRHPQKDQQYYFAVSRLFYGDEKESAQDLFMSEFNELRAHPELCASINFDNLYKPGSAMPNEAQTKAFLDDVGLSLACQRIHLVAGLSSRVFANVPTRIVEMLKSSSAVLGAYPAVGGTYGEKLVLMRAALNRYALHGDLLKEEFDAIFSDYQKMALSIQQLKLQHQIAKVSTTINDAEKRKSEMAINIIELQKDAAVIKGVMDMAQAAASASWMNPQSVAGAAAGAVGAGLLMENQLEQLEQQGRIERVNQEILMLQQQQQDMSNEQTNLGYAKDLIEARTALRARAMNVRKYINEMRTAYEEFDAAMASLETERNRALRALSRAMDVLVTRHVQEAVVDRTLGNITVMRQRRYELARKNAVRWAVLAKRAIEQRLGVHLAELQAPMALLD
ncbi:MAG: hypothetical protein QM784_35330 [Polyangiaceae bacterium]